LCKRAATNALEKIINKLGRSDKITQNLYLHIAHEIKKRLPSSLVNLWEASLKTFYEGFWEHELHHAAQHYKIERNVVEK
jgi:hypothetical protein